MQRKVRTFMSNASNKSEKRYFYHNNIYLYIEHIVIYVFTKAPLFAVTLTVTSCFSSLDYSLYIDCTMFVSTLCLEVRFLLLKLM